MTGSRLWRENFLNKVKSTRKSYEEHYITNVNLAQKDKKMIVLNTVRSPVPRLKPTQGAENLRQVTTAAREWVQHYSARFGIQDVFVDHSHALYPEVRTATLGLISTILTHCPLIGTDVHPKERTYVATPMSFRPSKEGSPAHLLRELGEALHPDAYSPQIALDLLGDPHRSELYKLNVGDSDIVGFSLDRYRVAGGEIGIIFDCFDSFAGDEGEEFGRVGSVSVRLTPGPVPFFFFDMMPRKIWPISIESYPLEVLGMKYLEE